MTSARYLSALLVALVATLALLSSQVVNAQMAPAPAPADDMMMDCGGLGDPVCEGVHMSRI